MRVGCCSRNHTVTPHRIDKKKLRIRRQLALLIMAALLSRVRCVRTVAAFLHHQRRTPRPVPRKCLLSLYARQERRDDSYSIEDLQRASEHRAIPPVFDSMMEDEGYGAYDYQPDAYDLQDMEREEQQQQLVAEQQQTAADLPPEFYHVQEEEVAIQADEDESMPPPPKPSSPPLPLVEEVLDAETSKTLDRSRTTPATHFHAAAVADGPLDGFLEKASSGTGVATELDRLNDQLESVAQEIYAQHKSEFNINSPKQVSMALYGWSGESTRKETLEGMAASGNRLADLILQYRALKAQIKRLSRRQQDRDKGTHVRSAMSVARPDASVETDADPLMLVDASAYIFRAYYAMPPFHRSDGMPTGAVLGFCNMLNRLVLNRILAGEQPRLVLVFDAKGPTFRHELYDQYKGNRPSAPMDLIPQFGMIREAAEAYGIAQIEAPRYEADDVIATLSTMGIGEGVDINILSGDKDLMQLVSDPDAQPSVHMIDPMTMSRVTYDQVLEKWGVGPDRLGDVLALAGDSSDNIPGVPGIGPKIAASLIEQFGSLEELYEQVDSVKQKGRREKLQTNQDKALLSRELVDLERHVPLELMSMPEGVTKVDDLRMEPVDTDRLLAFYDTMGFWELKRRLEDRLNRKSSSRPKPKTYRRPKPSLPKPEDYSDVPF